MTDPRLVAFGACYTGVVHDVMRAHGLTDFTLPPRITPLHAAAPAARAGFAPVMDSI